jgi:hypothetical protein
MLVCMCMYVCIEDKTVITCMYPHSQQNSPNKTQTTCRRTTPKLHRLAPLHPLARGRTQQPSKQTTSHRHVPGPARSLTSRLIPKPTDGCTSSQTSRRPRLVNRSRRRGCTSPSLHDLVHIRCTSLQLHDLLHQHEYVVVLVSRFFVCADV